MYLLLSAARDPRTHILDMVVIPVGCVFILNKLSLNKVLKRSITGLLEIESPVGKPQRNPFKAESGFW